MNKFFVLIKKKSGFTLLEIIVTLLFLAIYTVVMFQYFYNSPKRSVDSIQNFNESLGLQLVMENVIADYKAHIDSNKDYVDILHSQLSAMISAMSENCSVNENKFIEFDASGNEILVSEDDTENKNLLKIAIKNDNTGEILTTLLSRG